MGDGGRTTAGGGRSLTENEAAVLESLFRAAVELSNRCHQIEASIRAINAEGKQADWEALKGAFQGVVKNATQLYLSARLLELIEEEDIK